MRTLSCLTDGDAVTVIKYLKIKDASLDVKVRTKVKGICMINTFDVFNSSSKIDRIGTINRKSYLQKNLVSFRSASTLYPLYVEDIYTDFR